MKLFQHNIHPSPLILGLLCSRVTRSLVILVFVQSWQSCNFVSSSAVSSLSSYFSISQPKHPKPDVRVVHILWAPICSYQQPLVSAPLVTGLSVAPNFVFFLKQYFENAEGQVSMPFPRLGPLQLFVPLPWSPKQPQNAVTKLGSSLWPSSLYHSRIAFLCFYFFAFLLGLQLPLVAISFMFALECSFLILENISNFSKNVFLE